LSCGVSNGGRQALTAAISRAEKLPGYGGSWLDQSYLEEIDDFDREDARSWERHANDHKRLVLNLRFTGDPTVHEPTIREVWGGPLCLSQAEYTAAELQALQKRVQEEGIEGMHYVSADERTGHVNVGVWVATPELRHQVDDKYGKGLVVLDAFLKPAP
jgi:hypothetical protein